MGGWDLGILGWVEGFEEGRKEGRMPTSSSSHPIPSPLPSFSFPHISHPFFIETYPRTRTRKIYIKIHLFSFFLKKIAGEGRGGFLGGGGYGMGYRGSWVGLRKGRRKEGGRKEGRMPTFISSHPIQPKPSKPPSPSPFSPSPPSLPHLPNPLFYPYSCAAGVCRAQNRSDTPWVERSI